MFLEEEGYISVGGGVFSQEEGYISVGGGVFLEEERVTFQLEGVCLE